MSIGSMAMGLILMALGETLAGQFMILLTGIIVLSVLAVVGGAALSEAVLKALEPKRFWVVTHNEKCPTLHLNLGITELPPGTGPGMIYSFATYAEAADAWVKMESEYQLTAKRVEVQ